MCYYREVCVYIAIAALMAAMYVSVVPFNRSVPLRSPAL